MTVILLCGLVVDYSGKGTKSFDVLTGDQEIEVRTAIYGPKIDQSQQAKLVSHMIIDMYFYKTSLYWIRSL